MIKRKRTREVKVGNINIGGSNPIRVQSMTSTKTEDIDATFKQIEELLSNDCEIIRIAVPHKKAMEAFRIIRRSFEDIPLVADVHFNYRLALGVADYGADKIRINPGNIGDKRKVREIIHSARANSSSIRLGVNSGSLEKDIIEKYGGVTPDGLVESALRWKDFFEEENFTDIVISVKSASVPHMIASYRKLSELTDYPLHLGVTEAGPFYPGSVKSAIGIGTLLAEGIGDTIRVSLTASPVEEVKAGWMILRSLEIRAKGIILISCPTCSRLRLDILPIVSELERKLDSIKVPLKIAVMGCEVNGPGEAREADIGVAAAPGMGYIFKKGKIIKKVRENKIVSAILEEVHSVIIQNEPKSKERIL